jgi:hypothetical protein
MAKDTVLMDTGTKKVQFKAETLMAKEMTCATPIASQEDLTITCLRSMFSHKNTNILPVERRVNQIQAMKTAFMFAVTRTHMVKATVKLATLSMKVQFLPRSLTANGTYASHIVSQTGWSRTTLNGTWMQITSPGMAAFKVSDNSPLE